MLEIGAGLGSLTRHLAQAARQVTTVETDRRLFPVLEDLSSAYPNIRLVKGDIMEIPSAELRMPAGYLVVANIPYYLTSALLRRLLEGQQKPRRLVLTVQEEVARRICAAQGNLSLLAVSVRVYGNASIQMRIPAGAFYPPPEVDSAVLRIDLFPQPLVAVENVDTFFSLVKAGFSQKRKTILNALSAGKSWDKQHTAGLLLSAGIEPDRRAQTLAIEEWELLTNTLREWEKRAYIFKSR